MAEHKHLSALRFPLSAILESAATVRTLRVLYQHSGLIAAPSIVLQSGLAKASVAKALKSLHALGIAEISGSGRAALYQISNSHPLMAELFQLFSAEELRYQLILEKISRAAAERHAAAVWLYGSVSRGEDTAASDVDIAIVLDERDANAEDAIRSEVSAAATDLVFSPSIIFLELADISRLSAVNDPWWKSLLSNALVLHGQRPDWVASRLDTERSRNARSRK